MRYHERILDSILETGSTEDFIAALAELIKGARRAPHPLVGDIYDRGGGRRKSWIDLIACEAPAHGYPVGNHDLLWMGAAAGEEACVVSRAAQQPALRHYEILENVTASLRGLVAFADRTYRAGERITPLIKAINVLLFKLEGQIIQRHPRVRHGEERLLLPHRQRGGHGRDDLARPGCS